MRKSCLQCQAAFEITTDDLAFYEKVSPVFHGKRELIPPPTLCPDCRLQRRLLFRNERNLYRRTCDNTGQPIISLYAPEKQYVIYAQKEWWGDSWDALSFGKEMNFDKPFFEQVEELRRIVPRMALLQERNENSDYTSNVSNLKNCYLLFSSDYSQDCAYSTWMERSRDSLDCFMVDGCERAYEAVFSKKIYNGSFIYFSTECRDSAFLFNCHGCADCLLCWNLHRKSYCIENVQYSKEEYQMKRSAFDLSSNGTVETCRKNAASLWLTAIRPPLWRRGAILDSSGDFLDNVANCRQCYQASEAKDCAHVCSGFQMKDIMDSNSVSGELAYENSECFPAPTHSAFDANCYTGSDLYYCDHCMNNCQNLFGSIGLKHARYCILNKQYTKEEYERLVPRIIECMKQYGEWGEFFDPVFSPFGYNESEAQSWFPLSREEVRENGWKWREGKDEVPKVTKMIAAEKLPDSIADIPDDILNWAIQCEVTKRPFKIIKQELDFYRQMKLPIPRLHPDERHRRRMVLRNPRKLWKRECAKCKKEIQTTYAPDRPEIVFCEECYLKEVY